MSQPTPEDLLGYLLGALDEPEQAWVEEHLARDSRLREDLALLQKRLGLLAPTRREYEPSPGLAARTCALVASYGRVGAVDGVALEVADAEAREEEIAEPCGLAPAAEFMAEAPVERTAHWRWQDIAVAAAVLVAVGSLVFPAIHSSRFQTRVTTCQNNLRELGRALTGYSERHDGYFPQVPAEGRLSVAGIYAPTLVGDDYLTDVRYLVCPASELAERREIAVPPVEQLEVMPDPELAELVPTLGGSYGYSLGHTENGEYYPTRNLVRPTFALMADEPSLDQPGYQSDNHGGLGQNVLFEDGHVKFVTSPKANEELDDFFVNDVGLVAAGSHWNDSVVAPSASRPLLDNGAVLDWQVPTDF